MAHPYAPMGGSYDDCVVSIVVEEFLELGWVVGTFNFRGAHGSKSHTSWSGRPELDDYTSFAAFFIHYIEYLRVSLVAHLRTQSSVSKPTRPSKNLHGLEDEHPATVVLGGYSYGSLIVKHLPPLPTIVQRFISPPADSAACEILLRARKFADQSNREWFDSGRNLNEDEKIAKRGHGFDCSSHTSREDIDLERQRSDREVGRSTGQRSGSPSDRTITNGTNLAPSEQKSTLAISLPSVGYLIISPLTLPVSVLAAPALVPFFWNRSRNGNQDVFVKYPSLTVYGDQDIFASTKKIRHWIEQAKATPGSQLTSIEIEGAGHFWVEPGVEEILRRALRNWGKQIY